MINKSFGPIRLVIIQATSFCNINCDYCYLPNREAKKALALQLIEPIFKNILTSAFLSQDFTVCWHAGEPLTLPIEFYKSAIKKIQELDHNFNNKRVKISYSLQTNGMLINQGWCDLFKEYSFKVGVSLDGPAFIHDAHRKTRAGLGTHASTMRGIEWLQKNNLDFCIISVLTEQSLDYPEEMFNFFCSNGITQVGFNLEEIEGVNQSSSLQKSVIQKKLQKFYQRFWQLTTKTRGKFKLREFEQISEFLLKGQPKNKNQLSNPFSIISIDTQGNFSTYSPELLAMNSKDYGNFVLGNVLTDTFESVCSTEKFITINQDIQAGVNLCRDTCDYFAVCGGGAPSNKYWENGTFNSSETIACKYHKKMLTNFALTEI